MKICINGQEGEIFGSLEFFLMAIEFDMSCLKDLLVENSLKGNIEAVDEINRLINGNLK